MPTEPCPRCGSTAIVVGDVPTGCGEMARGFSPEPMTRWARWVVRSVPITGGPGRNPGRSHPRLFSACSACGFLWSAVSPEALRELIHGYGTEEARAELYGAKTEAGR